MLKRSAVRLAAQAIAQERFDRILQPICKGKLHLGLAISGGVDSMALASLCSRIKAFKVPPITAFIVDHRLRSGSTDEARSVAKNLADLGIASRVLTLDWKDTESPGTKSNLESVARRLRFQALGRACADAGISDLLLAHHGDDQAETVLSRIYAGYLGIGLQGIQAQGPIPECHGIYNVSGSGRLRSLDSEEKSTNISVESGGVNIHRPLLSFTKANLIATCQTANVRWHEDATNSDRTLTVRNAVRHLLEAKVLPTAIRSESLKSLAATKQQHRQSCKETATAMFKACKVELDHKSSCVAFEIHPRIRSWLISQDDPHLVAAMLMRKFLSLSEDQEKLQLKDLKRSVQYVFSEIFPHELPESSGINIGDVVLTMKHQTRKETGDDETVHSLKYNIVPRPVRAGEGHQHVLFEGRGAHDNASEAALTMRPRLFHSRWWISLRASSAGFSPNEYLVIRFLKKGDLAKMQDVRPEHLRKQLKTHAPGNIRFTIPAIVLMSNDHGIDGSLKSTETVCSLPTLGWHRPGFTQWGTSSDEKQCQYAFTYKNIDFEASNNHTIRPD